MSSTTPEILERLEEADESPEVIYIALPVVNEDSDEDSGDEDGGGLFDNLNIRQLHAPAEIVSNRSDRICSEEDEMD